jgi:L-rhamnose mutarotase
MNTQRLYFALDLKDDPVLIAEYTQWHQRENTWSEITQSIRDAGIVNMEIYLTGNRLFMVMEVDEQFNPQAKAEADAHNPAVQKWETLMNQFQQPLLWAKPGEKWVPMNCIFTLTN